MLEQGVLLLVMHLCQAASLQGESKDYWQLCPRRRPDLHPIPFWEDFDQGREVFQAFLHIRLIAMPARRARASFGLLLIASWLTWPACTAVDPLTLQISGKDVVDQASANLTAISRA